MPREQLALLKEIMAIEFAVIDLHLYLDTHPCDERALAEYNEYARQLACLKAEYTQRYGPLDAHSATADYPWPWICAPWPWEIEY